MCNIFIDHDAVKNARAFNFPSWYFLHTSIAFYVYFVRPRRGRFCGHTIGVGTIVEVRGEGIVLGDGTDSTEGKAAH